jgi:uncharacterized protein YbaP (TraB family)
MNFMFSKFRVLVVIVLSIWVFQSSLFAQKTPRYQGLLWEITGKGITRPSYLYGTMHVPEKLAFNLSDSFFVALKAVDMVSLETDHLIWQSFMEQMQEDQRNSAEVNYSSSNAGYLQYRDLYGSTFDYEAPDNRLFEAMFAYKPMMTNEFLFRSNQYRQDFEEDTYLDLFIFQAGKKLGKTVIGLETMEGSYESVTRARIPDDEEPTNERYYGGGDISEAYRKQDLSTLDSLNVLMSPGKNYRKWMLTERNAVMANGIDSIAQAGKTMFSAVGAAHLPGDDGVIEMLRRKGYTLRPITFSLDTDKKDMTEIENMKYPVKLEEHWAEDSVWSAKAPTRFYATSEGWRVSQSLSADMCNGAYYAVYRIKTYGLWVGQSPEYITQRIDSLIYEKVPGKIQERKRITAPFPGHEITTKTRRGDIQRYKIMVTPTEIIMFLMGGSRDYASGPEGNEFMNSIQLHNRFIVPQISNTTFQPKYGGFKVTFPYQPVMNTFDEDDIGMAYAATFDPGPDSTFYFLKRTDFFDPMFIEEDTFELNIFAERIAEAFTKKVPTLQLIQTTPYPTQDFSFQSERDQSWYYGRIVIDGAYYYLLGCRKKTAGAPEDFFKSFSIQPLKWGDGFENETDTVMRFKVDLPKTERKPVSQFYQNLNKIGEEITKKSRNNGYYDYESESNQMKSRLFSDDGTDYEILFISRPFTPEIFPTRDSFHRFMMERGNSEKLLTVQSANWVMQGDTIETGDVIFSDTNSNRRILHHFVLTQKSIYSLSSVVNGDQPIPEVVSRAFKTFVPTDTVALEPIVFGERDLSFFEQLYDADSLTAAAARQELEIWTSQKFEEKDFDLIRTAIEHPKFNKQPFEVRDNLISLLGSLKGANTLNYLQQLFARNADSIRLQVSVVEAIAEMKTKASTAVFMNLVPETITYFESNYYTWDVLEDSLELFQPHVKKLIALASKPSFHQEKALDILEDMLDEDLIRPKQYAQLKPLLIQDIRYEIQRNRYKEESSTDDSRDNRYGGYYENSYNSSQINVVTAYKLLLPFYKNDDVVQQLFEDGFKYGDQETKTALCQILLAEGHIIPEQRISNLLKDEKLRYPLYDLLITEDQMARYAHLFSDTMAIGKSFTMNRLYSYDKEDTLVLISRHKASFDGQPAILFFWDLKKKKEKEPKFVYSIMVLPQPVKKESIYRGYRRSGEAQLLGDIDTEAAKKEFIRKKMGEIRFEKRKRYRTNDRRYGGNYDY